MPTDGSESRLMGDSMRVLVTGSNGFIGGRFVRYLKELDDRGDVSLDLYLFDKAYGQDVRDYEQVLMAVGGMDCVFHLAALTHVDDSLDHPDEFFAVNALGTLQVLKAATKTGSKVVFVSTSEVYGDLCAVSPRPIGAKMDEGWPFHPCSPYAVAKAAADLACQVWYRDFETDVRIVRPFNQYGPGQTKQKLFAKFIQQAIEGKPLTVYGDGGQTRDYIYVDDTVKGIWAARDLRPGEVVNLCTGREVSVLEIAELVVRILASKSVVAKVGAGPRRPGEVQRMVGDPVKAMELLGWCAEVSLEEGVRRIADWFMVNGPIAPDLKVELRA